MRTMLMISLGNRHGWLTRLSVTKLLNSFPWWHAGSFWRNTCMSTWWFCNYFCVRKKCELQSTRWAVSQARAKAGRDVGLRWFKERPPSCCQVEQKEQKWHRQCWSEQGWHGKDAWWWKGWCVVFGTSLDAYILRCLDAGMKECQWGDYILVGVHGVTEVPGPWGISIWAGNGSSFLVAVISSSSHWEKEDGWTCANQVEFSDIVPDSVCRPHLSDQCPCSLTFPASQHSLPSLSLHLLPQCPREHQRYPFCTWHLGDIWSLYYSSLPFISK